MASELKRLSSAYQEAEAAFIRAVVERATYPRLGELADATASAADAYEAEAHRALAAGESAWAPLDELAEAAEQITSLWTDLADAFSGRPIHSDNTQLGQLTPDRSPDVHVSGLDPSSNDIGDAPNTPGFTPNVMDLLAEIVACGGETAISHLAEQCELTKPQLRRQLNWMEKQDLVNQSHDSGGRVWVRATVVGRAALQRVKGGR